MEKPTQIYKNLFEVKSVNGMYGLFALGAFDIGDVVIHIEGEKIRHPTKTSVQVNKGVHIEVAFPAKYINHSCLPNLKVVGNYFVCIKKIHEGGELVFDYTASEIVLSNPFKCFHCGQWIKGQKYVLDFPCLIKNTCNN